MNYMIKRDGQESGPYSLDQMREMLVAGQIDEAVLFRRYGTTDWLAAVDLEEELAASVGEAATTLPSATRPPPVKFCGLTDWQQVGAVFACCAIGIAVYLIYGSVSGKFAENMRKSEERRASEEMDGQVRGKAASMGLQDGREIALEVAAGKMSKPLATHIQQLAAERLKQSGAERLSSLERHLWLYEYEQAFKRAYKREFAW